MKLYTVLVKEDSDDKLETALFIKEGFSFLAAIFQTLWALYHKMWLCAAALIVVAIGFFLMKNYGIMKTDLVQILEIALLIFIGFSANDWYSKHLQKKGYIVYDVVSGKNEDEARIRFFDRTTTDS